jgi:O-antigen ligase
MIAERSYVSHVGKFMVVAVAIAVLLQEAKLGRLGLYLPGRGSQVSASGVPFLQEYFVLSAVFLLILIPRSLFSPAGARTRRVLAMFVYWALLVLIGAALLGLPAGAGAAGHLRMLAEGVALFFALSRTRWGWPEVHRVLLAFVVVMSIHASMLWLSFVAPGLLPFETYGSIAKGQPRLSGLFIEPSRAAFMLLIALAVSVSTLLARLERRWRILHIIAIPLLAGALLLTQTRAAVIAGVVALCYMLWSIRRLGLVVAIALVSMLVALSGVGRFDFLRVGLARFNGIGQGGSGVDRLDVLRVTFDLMMQYPLGSGAGALYEFSGGLRIPHAHNMFLQIAVMFGIPGLALFLWWLWSIFRLSSSRALADPTDLMVASGTFVLRSAIVAMLVACLAEPFLITNVGIWFWCFAGLIVAMNGARSPVKPNLAALHVGAGQLWSGQHRPGLQG